MRRAALQAVVLVLALATVAFADGPSATPKAPATVPQWVFYWVLGLSSAVGAFGLFIIKILWDWGKAAQDKAGSLTEAERSQLTAIHDVLTLKDANQTPLVYVPRQLINELASLSDEAERIRVQMQRLSEQHDGTVADLRSQVSDLRNAYDKLQNRMLRLAVRVQRAVEALAGLGDPLIEEDLGDAEEV